MGRIRNSHVELVADRAGWRQVCVVETDVELDTADDAYDSDAARELMDELRELRRSARFDHIRVRSRPH